MADDESVGTLAALYLGNILYALERCAMALEAEGRADDAAFYRAIGRKLAETRGREQGLPERAQRDPGDTSPA